MDNLVLKTVNQPKKFSIKRVAGVAAAVAGSVGSVLITTATHALSSADVTAATSGNDASGTIDTAAIWVIGIVVGIFATRKVIGFFGKG